MGRGVCIWNMLYGYNSSVDVIEESQMKILALDIATKTGWAVGCAEGQSGVWDLGAKKKESRDIRLMNLRVCLSDLDHKHGPFDLIAFEALYMQHFHTAITLAELRGMVKYWAVLNGLRILDPPVAPATIKKHATGRGNATKMQVQLAARKRWPHLKIVSDDQSDALMLWDYTRSKIEEEEGKGDGGF